MKHILIINLGGISGLLLSTPALRALRDLYPEAEISILVPSRISEIVKTLSCIDKVFIFLSNMAGKFLSITSCHLFFLGI